MDLPNESPAAKAKRLNEERSGLKIKTDKAFYSYLGINKIRFAAMLKGKKEPTVSELKRIAEVFRVPISELLSDMP